MAISFAPQIRAEFSLSNMLVSGVVPAYFMLTVSEQPEYLELDSGVFVSNRTLGILRFKYNIDVASLTISSNTASGKPEDSNGAPYNAGGAGNFRISFLPGCQTVDTGYAKGFVLTNKPVDVKSQLAGALVKNGIEESCEMTASYFGIPLLKARHYEMHIIVTMVSL